MITATFSNRHVKNGQTRRPPPAKISSDGACSTILFSDKPVSPDYLEKILDISRHMAEIKNLDALLNYALDGVIALVGAERGYVVLRQAANTLKIKAQRGVEGKELNADENQISTSIFSQVVETGQPLMLNDAQCDPNFDAAKSVISLKLRSIMCVPLMTQGETIGVIYVENRSFRNRFTPDNLPPMILFANQAAVAIENAVLIDTLEQRVAARTQELEESWSRLVEANELRTVWLSNIAHDLRTPLGLAITALSLLQTGEMGQLNDMQREWIGKSLAATQDAVNLTNDLFYLIKLEAGGITLQPQKVQLAEFLRNVHAVARDLPWAEGVSFELGMAPQLPDVVIDPLRIRQVLLNLLSNAQKFTRRGRVLLYATEAAGEIVMGVQDTGEGIPADKQELLFQRFKQIDNDPDRRSRGTGLGLAICRELVDMHGGRIAVESKEGQGSNFMFTLPLKPKNN